MRMRRRFADRNEGIMNPNLRGPAVDNTAGRRPTEFTQTGEGSWRMNQLRPTGKHIEDYTAGRMRWNPYPEMREHMVGQNKNWLSRIGGALKNEFGGSAMAGELNRGIADYNPARVTGEEYLTDAEKLELGLSTNPAGSLLVNEPTPGLNPATPPKWYKPWTYMWGPNAGWNRGGIASLRRYR